MGTLLCLALLSSLINPRVVLAYQIEPWYENLTFFGAPSGWNNVRMELIDDFTYFLPNISALAGQSFMFVSLVGPQLPTGISGLPLGNLNWKQGKLGVGALSRTLTKAAPIQFD